VSAEERSPGAGRASTVATSSELASGKLLLDAPAEHVVRLTIANPQRRGALDHEILDSLAETVRSLDARCLVLTGTVWKVECEVGQEVEEGDTVVIIESMKMEMPVEAEDDGTVKEIKCEEGQSVKEGDTLVVLEG